MWYQKSPSGVLICQLVKDNSAKWQSSLNKSKNIKFTLFQNQKTIGQMVSSEILLGSIILTLKHWLYTIGILLKSDYCHYQPGRYVKIKIQPYQRCNVAKPKTPPPPFVAIVANPIPPPPPWLQRNMCTTPMTVGLL